MPLVFGRSILGFGVVAAPPVGATWTADLTYAGYEGKSFDPTTQQLVIEDVFFKDDGLSMYTAGSNPDTIHQYTLSTAWDVSTASYASKSLAIGANESSPRTVQFKDDGTSLYIVGSASDTVYQYNLTTAWDVSTGSYASKSMSVNTQESNPRGLFFKDDGTKVYIVGVANDTVFQYALSTAWDISTGSYESKSFSVSTQTTSPTGVFFSPNGDEMYVIGYAYPNADVFKYTLSTAWDVSTASYDSISFSTATQGFFPSDLFFKPDGSKLYVTESNFNEIYQYASSAPTWTNPDLTTASYDSVSLSITSQDTFPTGIYFKPSGTKLYMSGRLNDAIYQYSLSTAWDLSTASYDSVSFSVATQSTFPEDVQFKTDGTSFYVSDRSNDAVYQYDLTTAWDISTASYANKSMSVASQENANFAIVFKPDGTKVYVVGSINDTVYQYSLSTAWDISTASYDSVSFSVATEESIPRALFFNPDGDKLWVLGAARRTYQYSLSTAWDVSTASYDSINFYSFSQDSAPQGLFFKSDGSKLYIIGDTNDTVYQYST